MTVAAHSSCIHHRHHQLSCVCQVISNFSGHPPHHLHLADDSGLSSSDSEVEARDDKILDDTSVETNVTDEIKSGDTSNPFEGSDNEEEDTVLDHIKLSDSQGESKKAESQSVGQNLPDSHNNQVGFEGEQLPANSELKSTNNSSQWNNEERDTGDINTQSDKREDAKEALEAEKTDNCMSSFKNTANTEVHVGAWPLDDTKQLKLSEPASTNTDTENKDVTSSESVTEKCDKGSGEPKQAADVLEGRQACDSGMITLDYFLNQLHAPQSERIRRNSMFCAAEVL